MAIKRHRKLGNHTYVYEEESYWDSEKKQGRKKLTYIGKLDPKTKKVIAAKKKLNSLPTSCRSYGGAYFLERLSNKLGLTKTLKTIYPEDYKEILDLVFFKLLRSEPFYLYPDWADETELVSNYSSQAISKTLLKLGRDLDSIENFFNLWRKYFENRESLMFDITSISTYSSKIEVAEYGYNRDKEKLKQFNIGLIASKKSGLPVAYRIYPGSINDVSTLHNAILLFKSLKLKASLFVLDKGFYSTKNLLDCDEAGLKVIVSAPFRDSDVVTMLAEAEQELTSIHSSFQYKSKNFFYCKNTLTKDNVKFDAHIFLDPIRKTNQMDNFLLELDNFEQRFEKKSFEQVKDVEIYIKQSGYAKFFSVTEEDKCFQITRLEQQIEHKILQMGAFILITNQRLSPVQILDYYRGKDDIEKVFNDLKNPLQEDRIRCKSQHTLQGKVFILFLALILYSKIKTTAKEKDLFKEFTIPQILKQIQKIKVFHLNNGQKVCAEISKKQKKIFNSFGIKLPNLDS